MLGTVLVLTIFSKLSNSFAKTNEDKFNYLYNILEKYSAQKYSLDQYFFKTLKDADIKKYDGNLIKFNIYADKYNKYVDSIPKSGIEYQNALQIKEDTDIKKEYLKFCNIIERGDYDLDNLKKIKKKFEKYNCSGSTETCVLKQLVLDKTGNDFKPKECHEFVFKTYKDNYQFGTRIEPLKIHTAFINNKWIKNFMNNTIRNLMKGGKK